MSRMTHQTLPLAEVTNRAIDLLSREMGIVDTVRFVSQFSNGFGDYTEDRDHLFADKSLVQILAEIKFRRSNTPK